MTLYTHIGGDGYAVPNVPDAAGFAGTTVSTSPIYPWELARSLAHTWSASTQTNYYFMGGEDNQSPIDDGPVFKNHAEISGPDETATCGFRIRNTTGSDGLTDSHAFGTWTTSFGDPTILVLDFLKIRRTLPAVALRGPAEPLRLLPFDIGSNIVF